MGRFLKIMAILIALSALMHYFSVPARAQPFGFMEQKPQKESQQTVLSSVKGRFAFGQVSDSSEDKFMLDTFTGRLWRLSKRTDIGLCLTAVPYRNAEGECSPLPEKISEPGNRAMKNK